MPDEPLRVLEDPSAADLELLENQINEYNFTVTGHRDGRTLTIFLRDDRGAIRAGLSGHTWGAAALLSSKLVPNVTLKIHRGTPHGLAQTRQAEFNADLLAFIES